MKLKLQASSPDSAGGGAGTRTMRHTAFYADDELLAKLDKFAGSERRSRSNMIIHILTQFFERKEAEDGTK